MISIKGQLQTVFSNKNADIVNASPLFPGLLFSLPWPDAAFRIACPKCLVISQGSRFSLEDPDIGYENDHEPKLTMPGTARTANLGSRCSSSSLIHDNSLLGFIVAYEEIRLTWEKKKKKRKIHPIWLLKWKIKNWVSPLQFFRTKDNFWCFFGNCLWEAWCCMIYVCSLDIYKIKDQATMISTLSQYFLIPFMTFLLKNIWQCIFIFTEKTEAHLIGPKS